MTSQTTTEEDDFILASRVSAGAILNDSVLPGQTVPGAVPGEFPTEVFFRFRTRWGDRK